MGGAYPLAKPSSEAVSRPPNRGVPWCLGTIPLGAMGTIPNTLRKSRALSLWPKGPWPPLLGAKYTRERLAGGRYPPYYSLGSPPRMAPHSRGSTTSTPEVLGVALLVVKIGKNGLVIF